MMVNSSIVAETTFGDRSRQGLLRLRPDRSYQGMVRKEDWSLAELWVVSPRASDQVIQRFYAARRTLALHLAESLDLQIEVVDDDAGLGCLILGSVPQLRSFATELYTHGAARLVAVVEDGRQAEQLMHHPAIDAVHLEPTG